MPTALDAPPRETACTIDWGGLGAPDWDWLFEALPRSNPPAIPQLCEAICPSLGQTARRGLIRIDGAPAGLVQIQEASLMRRALHAVILDRGPLWFDGFGAAAQQAAFWAGFNAAFPRRPGRRRRLIPESTHAPALFAQAGLQAVAGRESYQTIWLDLNPEKNTLPPPCPEMAQHAVKGRAGRILPSVGTGAAVALRHFWPNMTPIGARGPCRGPIPRF